MEESQHNPPKSIINIEVSDNKSNSDYLIKFKNDYTTIISNDDLDVLSILNLVKYPIFIDDMNLKYFWENEDLKSLRITSLDVKNNEIRFMKEIKQRKIFVEEYNISRNKIIENEEELLKKYRKNESNMININSELISCQNINTSESDIEYLNSSDEVNNYKENITKIKNKMRALKIKSTGMLFFIDKSIGNLNENEVNLEINLLPGIYNVNLGSRIYSVLKVHGKEDETIFDVLKLFLDIEDDLHNFMTKYKILQITGIIIHPLTRIKDISYIDKYVIVTSNANISLGIDSALFKKRKIRGLKNLGNTCYMNSALQAIFNCKEFSDYFFYNENKNRSPRKVIYNAFGDLLLMLDKCKDAIDPSNFKNAMGSKIDIYNDILEQDSAEFISDFFNLLHDEIKINKKSKNRNIDSYQKWQIENQSIITDLFFTKLESSISCSNCHKRRSVYEPSLLISIPIVEQKKKYIEVIIFYCSLTKIPLKISVECSQNIEQLKRSLKVEYNIENDIYCCSYTTDGTVNTLNNNTLLENISSTIYCYEYRRGDIDGYFWIKIIKKYFFWNTHMKLFILGYTPNEVNQEIIYNIVKQRLIPFLDSEKYALLDKRIESVFTIAYPDQRENSRVGRNKLTDIQIENNLPYTDMECDDLSDLREYKLSITHFNCLSTLGYNFDPITNMTNITNTNIDISDCLNIFLEKEYIFGNNKQYCDMCKEETIHYKKLDIVRSPKYMIIQLKRFKFTGNHFTKISTFVDFDLEAVIVNNTSYRVIGIINHLTLSSGYNYSMIGSSGHYTTYIRYNNDWYLCNDNTITHTKDIDKSNAYILFLERID